MVKMNLYLNPGFWKRLEKVAFLFELYGEDLSYDGFIPIRALAAIVENDEDFNTCFNTAYIVMLRGTNFSKWGKGKDAALVESLSKIQKEFQALVGRAEYKNLAWASGRDSLKRSMRQVVSAMSWVFVAIDGYKQSKTDYAFKEVFNEYPNLPVAFRKFGIGTCVPKVYMADYLAASNAISKIISGKDVTDEQKKNNERFFMLGKDDDSFMLESARIVNVIHKNIGYNGINPYSLQSTAIAMPPLIDDSTPAIKSPAVAASAANKKAKPPLALKRKRGDEYQVRFIIDGETYWGNRKVSRGKEIKVEDYLIDEVDSSDNETERGSDTEDSDTNEMPSIGDAPAKPEP